MRAGLAAVLSLLVMALAAPAASAAPWSCNAFGYLFQNPGAVPPGTVYQVDLATGQYSTAGTTANAINAVAYNPVDDYMYGWAYSGGSTGAPVGHLVRINSDLTEDDLGVPAGTSATTAYNIGDVDGSGHYWMAAGTTVWHEIDLTAPTPTVLRSGTISNPTGLTLSADWAWIGDTLYMTGHHPVTRELHLMRFNPATGAVSDVGGTGFILPPQTTGFGAVYADGNGYFYASDNGTGRIYRIDPVSLNAILVANGPAAGNNDGARCANAPIPTITATKTVNGRVRAADQFTVAVVKPDGTTGDSATTSGGATTVSTVNFPASQGQTYTITDAMAANSPTPLGEYVKSIACTDAAGNAVPVGGTGPSWTLTVAQATNYTCNVTNRAVADLRLEKSAAPTPVVPGEDVTWTMTVTNNGPSTSIGETVTDDLPDEVTFASASAGCGEANGVVTCAVGELAPGASKSFTITARVASSLDTCLRNTGTVSGQFDPDTSTNTSSICTPIRGRSNVAITKVASTPRVASGGQVMYTLVVRNNGPSDDPGVQVSDPLPAGLALVSAQPSQGSCTTTNNAVSCDLGALRDRGSAQVLVTANVTATSGCINNTARVLPAHEDPNPDNNQATAQVCVDPPPPARFDLEVDKRASVSRPYVGQSVTYTVVVTNNGPDAAPDARVTDTFNNRATLVSARAEQGTCTRQIPMTCDLGRIEAGASVTITVVIKPRESGRARNAASATSCCGTDTTPDNNIDTVDVNVRKVALKVSKVAGRSTVQGGETFSYRIRVRNPTRGQARNVKVCDRLPFGLSYVSSKPAGKRQGSRQRCWTAKLVKAGQSRTYRITVRAARGASGRKTNTATVSGPDVQRVRARAAVRVRAQTSPVTG